MSSARRLALSRLASLTAGSAAYIALISAIYTETGSALWVSAALFAGVVGSVVGAPAAGWIGDRFERRRVMVGSDLAAAVVAAAMALTIDSALALTLLFGLLAVVQSPFEPSSASAMPNLVPPESLPRANALVAGTTSASYLLGPLLGGLLLGAGASAPQLLAVDAVSFLVSAALVVSIRRPFGLGGGTESEPGVWAGVRLIVEEPVLRVLIAASIVSLLGMGMVNVANYPLSIHLGGGTEGYGALEALLGGGGLVGAAIAARMLSASRAPLIVTVTFAVSGAGLLLAGLAPVLAVALAGHGDRRGRPRARGRGRHDARPGADRRRAPQPRLRRPGRRGARGVQRGDARRRPARRRFRRAHGRRDRGRMRLRGGIGCKPHAPE